MNADYERLRELRKHFNLSQTEFAERIGVTRSVIKNLELGVVAIKGYMFKLISREFNVNEDWLRNGTGEMFIKAKQDILDELAVVYNINRKEKAIIQSFLDSHPQERAVMIKYIENLINTYTRQEETDAPL